MTVLYVSHGTHNARTVSAHLHQSSAVAVLSQDCIVNGQR